MFHGSRHVRDGQASWPRETQNQARAARPEAGRLLRALAVMLDILPTRTVDWARSADDADKRRSLRHEQGS